MYALRFMHRFVLQQGVDETAVSFSLEEDSRVSGFAGWFTADFNGTDENPCPCPVTLSTGPENGYTHWGQQVFRVPCNVVVVGVVVVLLMLVLVEAVFCC